MTTTTQTKVHLLRIELERAEGPAAELKAVTLYSWEECEATLREWAKTAPTRSCDKCDMVLFFDDGDSFDIGFDLKNKHQRNAQLTDFVRKELQFMTGDWTPEHMTKQEHQKYLKTIKPEILAEYRRCLDTWVIPE